MTVRSYKNLINDCLRPKLHFSYNRSSCLHRIAPSKSRFVLHFDVVDSNCVVKFDPRRERMSKHPFRIIFSTIPETRYTLAKRPNSRAHCNSMRRTDRRSEEWPTRSPGTRRVTGADRIESVLYWILSMRIALRLR